MGQRLNIEIIHGGETLANAYYHWSAYTSSSFELTKLILENVDKIQHHNPVVRAIRLLETTGALLTSEEINQIDFEEHFEKAVSRNDGLIAISENGIDTSRRWEEGRVEINLDEETVNFNVFWRFSKEEYLEDYEETEEQYQKLPLNTHDFSHIPFNKFNQIAAETLQMIENKVYKNRLEDGRVLGFIE